MRTAPGADPQVFTLAGRTGVPAGLRLDLWACPTLGSGANLTLNPPKGAKIGPFNLGPEQTLSLSPGTVSFVTTDTDGVVFGAFVEPGSPFTFPLVAASPQQHTSGNSTAKAGLLLVAIVGDGATKPTVTIGGTACIITPGGIVGVTGTLYTATVGVPKGVTVTLSNGTNISAFFLAG